MEEYNFLVESLEEGGRWKPVCGFLTRECAELYVKTVAKVAHLFGWPVDYRITYNATVREKYRLAETAKYN